MARVLVLLPNKDFDPTESSVPWRVLSDAGHDVRFATEDGRPGQCDQRTLTGDGLSIWAGVLKAKAADAELYRDMTVDRNYASPMTWASVEPDQFDALVLPGGHAAGMRPYLESEQVQSIIRAFFQDDRPVAAVCHGVLAVARTTVGEDGRSVLHGRKTTGLNNLQERTAILMTRPFLGDHYATYPVTVQDEVSNLLAEPADFQSGPVLPRFGTAARSDIGFVVADGNYLSARWPGDVHRWARAFRGLLAEHMGLSEHAAE